MYGFVSSWTGKNSPLVTGALFSSIAHPPDERSPFPVAQSATGIIRGDENKKALALRAITLFKFHYWAARRYVTQRGGRA
jgi:hypothetical protein